MKNTLFLFNAFLLGTSYVFADDLAERVSKLENRVSHVEKTLLATEADLFYSAGGSPREPFIYVTVINSVGQDYKATLWGGKFPEINRQVTILQTSKNKITKNTIMALCTKDDSTIKPFRVETFVLTLLPSVVDAEPEKMRFDNPDDCLAETKKINETPLE